MGDGTKGLDTTFRWESVWVSKGGKEEEYSEEADENIICWESVWVSEPYPLHFLKVV